MTEGNGRATLLTSTLSENQGTPTQIDGSEWFKRVISESRRCDACDIDYPDPVPRLFNFNNPLGACPTCEGFGDIVDFDMDLVVPDKSRSLAEGAIAPWNSPAMSMNWMNYLNSPTITEFPLTFPFASTKKHLKLIKHGVPERTAAAWILRVAGKEKYKMHVVFLRPGTRAIDHG